MSTRPEAERDSPQSIRKAIWSQRSAAGEGSIQWRVDLYHNLLELLRVKGRYFNTDLSPEHQ